MLLDAVHHYKFAIITIQSLILYKIAITGLQNKAGLSIFCFLPNSNAFEANLTIYFSQYFTQNLSLCFL